jgi:hypothetical protein
MNVFIHFFFGGTRDGTLGFLLLLWWTFYHFSHTSSSFCFRYFGDGGDLTKYLPLLPPTKSLLLSVSQVSRITGIIIRPECGRQGGVSHQCPAFYSFLIDKIAYIYGA